jgi:hypothetical protein
VHRVQRRSWGEEQFWWATHSGGPKEPARSLALSAVALDTRLPLRSISEIP